jgi:hypothetical protein
MKIQHKKSAKIITCNPTKMKNMTITIILNNRSIVEDSLETKNPMTQSTMEALTS